MRQVRWLGLLVLFVLPACARGGGYDEHDAGGGGGRLDAMVVQLMDAGSQPTPDAGVVVPPPVDAGGCVPSCVGRTCGDDGCGGSCGTCTTGTCVSGTCSCTPNCTGRTCGDDGCGGSCGTCGSLCTDTCLYAFDFDCDDGGPFSDYSLCALGTDCFDCGVRTSVCVSGTCM